jgi:DNA-binding response OmpR family regulator
VVAFQPELHHRILLIDDDADSRDIYRQTLEWSGYAVETAANGRAGLRAAMLRPPDAILLDLDMPGMSGIDVLRELRAEPRTSRVPVAALTGAPELLDYERSVVFDMVIAKPAVGDEVSAAVRRLVNLAVGS